jgi:23S rRNA pseudouridine2605 synthase
MPSPKPQSGKSHAGKSKAAPEKAEAPRGGERLQKILATAGVASRRKAEELILDGRVQVNGQVVTEMGFKADAASDHIRVDGKLLQGPEKLRYFMLNKPKGYVTTVSDPEGRHTVMEFFHGRGRGGERLYPVGRLDYASEGLLLMTNDGTLANALTKASSHVEKIYLVKVSGRPTEEQLDQIRAGIMIDRGRPGEGRVMTAPAGVRMVRDAENPWFELTLIEGRNREIRKMFEETGHFVEKIRRIGYGPLVLDVEPGEVRELTTEEVDSLRRAAQRKRPKKVGAATRTKALTMLPKAKPARSSARGGRPGKAAFGKTARTSRSGQSERAGQGGGSRSGSGSRPGSRSGSQSGSRPGSGSGSRSGSGSGRR